MVGLQVDRPLGVVLGCSKGLCGRSWVDLRACVGGPGPLSEPLWAVLVLLGAFVEGPGPSWVRSWVLCWRSWDALGTYVRGLGGSWGLCWRSLGRLGLKKVEEHDYLKNVFISQTETPSAARGRS